MTKKISWLSFMAVFLFLLNSCVHDEIYSASASEEYHSKSLWKEDEIYIKNIIKIYEENENEIRKEHGAPLWEYAMTMDKFDESYLVVPVRRNGKIVEVLEVPRFGRKVYFRYSDDDDKVALFNQLITDRPKKPLPASSVNMVSKIVCVVKTFSTWYPDNENNPNGSGHWETSSYTICTDLTIDTFENPDDGSGNGGYDYPPLGGGYENPTDSIAINKTPCEKTKAKISDPKFKAKYQELNKPEMFAMDHEKGFYERLPPVGSNLPSGFPVVDGAPCTHGLDFPDNEDGVAGLMHIHNDNDCDGNPSIKIFSPKDVRTFLNILMKQARIYTGSYTNASSTVITSQGNYMLQYTNDIWPGSTWDKIDDWNDWYTDAYQKLIDKDQFTQANVEKVFTQFLKEKVGINGLEVYKITENSSSKLEYNGVNHPVISTPCPQ